MRHEFTVVYERDDELVIAYCPAIVLLLEDRGGPRGVPAGAEREVRMRDLLQEWELDSPDGVGR